MKLCFECSEYPPGLHGGIGSLVQILARGLVQNGHEVRVVGSYRPPLGAPEREDDMGVEVWRQPIPLGRWGWLKARRQVWSTIQSWCSAGEVDLVEVPDWGAPAAGWPSLGVPVVSRLSGSASYFSSEMGRRPGFVDYVLEGASLRRSDFLCSNSQYIASRTREVFGLPKKADAILYTPVEVQELSSKVSRDWNQVVFAGTLTEKKGVISLMKTWPIVKRAWPAAELHIWGKDGKTPTGGSMQKYLSSLLSPELRAGVHFHGHVPLEDLLIAFQRAGVTVLPSYAEGFALTPLHAMAAGSPTIYTTRGSGPELIADGESGLLADPDCPEEIATAILSLLKDRKRAQSMGEKGRSLVQRRFSWPALRAENEDFYRDCVEEFVRRGKSKTRGISVLVESAVFVSCYSRVPVSSKPADAT